MVARLVLPHAGTEAVLLRHTPAFPPLNTCDLLSPAVHHPPTHTLSLQA